MASRSTPKRMQSIESGQREPAIFNTHMLPISSLPPVLLTALGLPRNSLSLYKVFHKVFRGSGSLSNCLTVSKTMGGLTRPFVHLVAKS